MFMYAYVCVYVWGGAATDVMGQRSGRTVSTKDNVNRLKVRIPVVATSN